MTKEEFEITERMIDNAVYTCMMVSTHRVIAILESALELEKDEKEKGYISRLLSDIIAEQCMGIDPYQAKMYSDVYRTRYLDKIQ